MKRFIPLICFFLVIFSCSKAEVKRPSEEAIIAKEAMDFVNGLKKAYMDGDEERLKEMLLYNELIKKFSMIDRPSKLEFTFRWIEIKEEEKKAEIYVAWRGYWKKEGVEEEARGLCLFVLQGRPFKLSKILRENPFLPAGKIP
ncbi:MAG: hypothetical protein N2257_08575 [Thermodesulfovibrionales bacterium]|nr:hypothetical protein [Thermodesulfovibrionales bacterium]